MCSHSLNPNTSFLDLAAGSPRRQWALEANPMPSRIPRAQTLPPHPYYQPLHLTPGGAAGMPLKALAGASHLGQCSESTGMGAPNWDRHAAQPGTPPFWVPLQSPILRLPFRPSGILCWRARLSRRLADGAGPSVGSLATAQCAQSARFSLFSGLCSQTAQKQSVLQRGLVEFRSSLRVVGSTVSPFSQ